MFPATGFDWFFTAERKDDSGITARLIRSVLLTAKTLKFGRAALPLVTVRAGRPLSREIVRSGVRQPLKKSPILTLIDIII